MKKLIAKSIALGAAVCGAILLTSAPAHAMREMDAENSPFIFLKSYEAGIHKLPTSGVLNYPLWSDTYWPSHFGGAAWRWQISQTPGSHPEADPHNYQTYPVWQLAQMSDEQLNVLSPAEKYDLATGRYDYPTVRRERARTSPSMPNWNGLCHAVAAVTSRYFEPQNKNIVFMLPDGTRRNLMFYASDIKSLLALSADQSLKNAVALGRTCLSGNANADDCWDTNPASFYISLTNLIGLRNEPLIMDVDPGLEIWNTVIKSYSAKLTDKDGINPRAAPGTAREVRVDMTVQHTLGAKPAKSSIGVLLKTETYAFTLELDANDDILGGEWISTKHPDSLWVTNNQMVMDPNFSFLQYLVVPLH